ncbi:MAG: hypothetical protein Q9214_002848 [Letrouitia sp. 1 TL-2023]
MSPPEPKPIDSFSPTILKSAESTPTTNKQSYNPENTLPPISNRSSPALTMRVLPSPPVSPWPNRQYKEHFKDDKGVEGSAEHGFGAKDPVLYPDNSSQSEVSVDQPLFPSEPTMKAAQEIVTKHIATHRFKNKIAPPSREEYLLALSCVSSVGRGYNRNPGAYLKRIRDDTEDQYWKSKRICGKPGVRPVSHVPIAPAPSHKQGKKTAKAPLAGTPSTRTKRTPKPTPKASPATKMLNYPSKGRSETPEIRIPGAKRPEDVDYDALPDFSPPTSTLPLGNPKSLKADWPSSNILNLSNDPDRHLLHEAELNLAGTLRLSCATYLCSKRRIFAARLNALRIGKEFRKTDAQQACKIDVNKASKLWTAYDKVGWFSKSYFEQFL